MFCIEYYYDDDKVQEYMRTLDQETKKKLDNCIV